jgi:hypothetical protein
VSVDPDLEAGAAHVTGDRDDLGFDDGDDPEHEDFFDCHMGPSGYCGAAGSEDCEFECQHRREQRERAYARRKKDKPGALI